MEIFEAVAVGLLGVLVVVAAFAVNVFRKSEHGKRVELAFDLVEERVREIYNSLDALMGFIDDNYSVDEEGNYIEDEVARIALFIEDQVEEWIKKELGVSVDIRRIRDLIRELLQEDNDDLV